VEESTWGYGMVILVYTGLTLCWCSMCIAYLWWYSYFAKKKGK